MEKKEAMKRLNVSRATLDRYRNELNILDETRVEISETQLKLMEELKQKKVKHTKNSEVNKLKREALKDGYIDVIEIKETDTEAVKRLKIDYNKNRKIIDFLHEYVKQCMDEKKAPTRDVLSSLESYQKLNINVLKALDKEESKTSGLEAMITRRLNNYQ